MPPHQRPPPTAAAWSLAPRLGRPPGVASRWLRQPGPGTRSRGFGACEEDGRRAVRLGQPLALAAEFKNSFTTFHSLSPERSMSLWPTPGRLTSRAWPPMALVSSSAIQGRVSASSVPLMTSVGQSMLLALERASNGPMANEVLPRRARSIPQASRLVHGLSSTCALTSRRLARSIATALPRDQPISVTWSTVIDACRCRYLIAASAER